MRYHLERNKTLSFLFFLLCMPVLGNAQQSKGAYPAMETGWSFPVSGGFVHQFDSNLDDGGSFSADRFYIQGRSSYSIAPGHCPPLAAVSCPEQ